MPTPRPLLVQKFGGSSVAGLYRLQRVADIILKTRAKGYDVVAVVSAMGKETNRLLALAQEIDVSSPIELDQILCSGEQVSAALLSMCLQKKGALSRSLSARDIKIHASSTPGDAHILSVETSRLRDLLCADTIPVVTGFQGVAPDGRMTTLGRGGSDLTAVAVAAALKANECQIYTDVEGVYTADPRYVPTAQLIKEVPIHLMRELACSGAGVLQDRCLNYAAETGVPVRVLSSTQDRAGTLLVSKPAPQVCDAPLTGIATQSGYSLVVFSGIPKRPGSLSYVLAAITMNKLNIFLVSHLQPDDGQSGSYRFICSDKDLEPTLALFDQLKQEWGGGEIASTRSLSKVTLVGSGLDESTQLVSEIMSIAAQEGADPLAVVAASTRLSLLIPEQDEGRLYRALHDKLFKQSQVTTH